MNLDPIDPLNAFYADCRIAPVPDRLLSSSMPTPWWLRLPIPVGGLALGGFAALLLISMPLATAKSSGRDFAKELVHIRLNLAERQLEQKPPADHVGHAGEFWQPANNGNLSV